jgi:tetratricopeptide (TPR) repeat protein
MIVAVYSCSDEFQQVPATGALSSEALANADGVDLLLTGAYSSLNGTRFGGSAQQFSTGIDNWWMDCLSDDSHKGSTDGDQQELFDLETYTILPSNSYIQGKFQSLYSGLNRANAVIALGEQITDADVSAQVAEAYFLRGFWYFELTKLYGNVSIISIENFNNSEYNQPNNGPAWDQVESDFQFAIDNLPEDQGGSGRPTSGAARAFLAKTHLYQGEWAEALALFNTVINSGEYALNSEYSENFRGSGELSSEVLFSVQHSIEGGGSPNGNIGSLLSHPGGGPYGSCCGFFQPSIDLGNAFQTDANGLPLFEAYNDSDISNDYGIESFRTNENGEFVDEMGNVLPEGAAPVPTAFDTHTGNLDPRIDYTVGRRDIDFNGWGRHIGKDWIRAGFSDISGPYLAKKTSFWADEEAELKGNGGWGQIHSGLDYNIMRYADVLLMAAEAAVETGNLDLALNYVNQVRNRAKNMSYVQAAGGGDAANYVIEPYSSFSGQDMAREAVRFERRVELGMEGHRMFDLRRWGTTVTTLNEYVQNESRTIENFGTKARNYTNTYDLLPIPIGSIDLSGGALTQNPGY